MAAIFTAEAGLDQYLRWVADRVGLRDWKIILDDEAPEDDCAGQCKPIYGRRIAHIRLAEHDTADELRNTIVHELLHCHLEPIDWSVRNIETNLGDMVFGVFHSGFVDALEVAVDAIATVFAALLPLPDEWERGQSASTVLPPGPDNYITRTPYPVAPKEAKAE